MKRFAIVSAVFACVSALALAAMPRAQAEAPKCDAAGSCPLHDWMEKEMDGALEKGDLKALGAAYEKLAGMAPDPKWNDGEAGWSAIAKAGAEAAKKGDSIGVKTQCKTCHKAWRGKYKDSFRTKPLPK